MAKVEVKSEITGKVWKIERKAGDTLAEDDAILILESMKMEIPVAAPSDGTLLEVLVTEEEMVEEDQVVAIMDEA
jgi:acetyl-CoA carboxylase biotin carboxyl carrier protein